MLTPGAQIAVTGATGFIGGHLVRALLERGYRVRALARRPQTEPPESAHLTWVSGSLSDHASLERLVAGCEAVIHLAGAIKALGRNEFFAANTDGTRALAEIAARQMMPPRFVFVSSLAAREPYLSPYAASKRAAEQALLPYASRMPITVVRPPAVYGPGDRETLRLFQMAARGFVLAPGRSNARFSLIHGADAAMAIMAAMQAMDDAPGVTSKPWEPDDGKADGYSWAEAAAAAGAAVGTRPRLITVPAPVLYTAGLAGTLAAQALRRPSVLTWTKVPEIVHDNWVVSGGPIPGYTPRWNISTGFKNTVDWAISQGLLKSYI